MTVVSREKWFEREMIRGKKRFMNDRQFTPLWRQLRVTSNHRAVSTGVSPQCFNVHVIPPVPELKFSSFRVQSIEDRDFSGLSLSITAQPTVFFLFFFMFSVSRLYEDQIRVNLKSICQEFREMTLALRQR